MTAATTNQEPGASPRSRWARASRGRSSFVFPKPVPALRGRVLPCT